MYLHIVFLRNCRIHISVSFQYRYTYPYVCCISCDLWPVLVADTTPFSRRRLVFCRWTRSPEQNFNISTIMYL